MAFLSLSPQGATLTVDELASAATHIGLFSADPIAAGNLSSEQPAANGYARQAVSWSTVSAGVKQNSADILWEASGAAWNQGPWYIVLMSASTSGDPLAIVVDEDGVPQTTFDIAGVNTLQDGQRLKIPANNLMIGAGLPPQTATLDPVAEILAMQPTLFWVFDRAEYNSVQLLFQDDAATTPVTSNGDPVGCAKDLVLGREFTQSTSGSRPEYGAGVGLIFDGTDDWLHGEDCSDLMGQTAQGDTKTVGFTVFSEADNTTTQRKFFGNDQSAQQAGIGVGDSNSPSQGGLVSASNGNLVVPYADFYQIKHGVIREFQNYGTVYGNNHAATFTQTSLILLDNPTLGRYNHSTASQYWLGNIGCCVMFDRVLNIPELAKLQRMLLRIGQ